MKKLLWSLILTALLSAPAIAGKKKDSPPPQDGTDWLNAPTPDGSPTLRATSDWLGKTLEAYGGDNNSSDVSIHIDNDCSFHVKFANKNGKHTFTNDLSFPLGAVTSVDRDPDNAQNVKIATGNVAVMQMVRHGWNNYGTNYYTNVTFEVAKYPEVKPGGEIPQPVDQMLPRIVNAFQHAMSLCRSAYQAPSSNKEPF